MPSKRLLCSLLCLFGLFSLPVFANSTIDDFMRSTGKIYVVVAVVMVIFLAIIVYLVVLDRRIQKLEKTLPNGENQ